MDRVRFGRALGYGARHAAKSLKKAADAASAPSPSRPASSASQTPASQTATPQPAAARAVQHVAQRVVQTQQTVVATKTHARALGRSVWSPLARFSSVLWLQVTGTFFTLLALFLSQGLWKQRGVMRLPITSHAAGKFYVHLVAFVFFAYFAISNFVRAHLRERR